MCKCCKCEKCAEKLKKIFEFDDTAKKLKKLVGKKYFDTFIMALIGLNAVVFGLATSDFFNTYYGDVLFLIDRLCMAIFLLEMAMKLIAYGAGFFKSGWNVFDFAVIMISSLPFTPYLIVLRTFRLFRFFKYMRKFYGLRRLINTFVSLLPSFFYALLSAAVFVYAFAIISVMSFGNDFIEFSDLGNATFALLQVFTLDGWAANIARPIMSLYPHSWIFFISFVMISFMIVASFIINAVSDAMFRMSRQNKHSPKTYQKKPHVRKED